MVARPSLTPEIDLNASTAMWIVFSDETDIRVLKILKRGFRHCFIIMSQDSRWILIDPRSNKVDVNILPHPSHFNFPRYFTEQGKTVLKVAGNDTPKKIAPVITLSCVEMIKRFLGLHNRWIFTPYQLFKYLQKGQR